MAPFFIGDKEAGPELRANPAFGWLRRLRALQNIEVIEPVPAAAGGAHDFSQYGVGAAYEAGRCAVVKYLAQREDQQAPLRAVA